MNNDEDQNLIELLKQALYFYANEDNYNGTENNISLVAIDRGHQARFALQKVRELTDALDKIGKDYDKYVNGIVENEGSAENILKIIEDMKNVANED